MKPIPIRVNENSATAMVRAEVLLWLVRNKRGASPRVIAEKTGYGAYEQRTKISHALAQLLWAGDVERIPGAKQKDVIYRIKRNTKRRK